jgi:uncharacterized phage protein (TIGR01671 family)
MRPIEFRGKSKDNGEWVYGDLSHERGMILVTWIIGKDSAYPVHPNTVGQWIGKYDVNKNKIFEHDIVRTQYFGSYVGNSFDFTGIDTFEVVYSGSGFKLENKKRSYVLRDDVELEVIGNKFDTPELLGGGA